MKTSSFPITVKQTWPPRSPPVGFVTGRKHKIPNPASTELPVTSEGGKEPFHHVQFSPLLYFTEDITHYQMVFVRANWQTLEALFRVVWMENLKAVVCAESKYCI